MAQTEAQRIPLRIYQSENRVMLAAPMPGLEAEDISVAIDGDRVTIHGDERGHGQHDLDLLVTEWTFGPYHRDVSLSTEVDASLVNATYGNGVLVLSMPKLKPGEKKNTGSFVLHDLGQARGERVGHKGKTIESV